MSAATTGASHNFANDKWTRVPGLRTTACTSGLATANVNLAIVHHGWEFRLRVIVDDEVAHPHTATFPGDGAKSFTFVAPDMTPGLHTFAVQTRPIGQGANVEISGGSLILQYAAGAC